MENNSTVTFHLFAASERHAGVEHHGKVLRLEANARKTKEFLKVCLGLNGIDLYMQIS